MFFQLRYEIILEVLENIVKFIRKLAEILILLKTVVKT